MKIMILDPHVLFRVGLLSLLSDQPNLQILENLNPNLDAMKQVSSFEPDVIIMGGDLYEEGGRKLMLEILAEYPNIAILILAFKESDELMLDVIRNGAKGYLPMDFSKPVLIKSLYAMVRGEVAISRSMTTRMVEEFSRMTTRITRDRWTDVEDSLPFEQEVLHGMTAQAMTNEVTLKFFLSSEGIQIQVGNVIKKLDLKNQ